MNLNLIEQSYTITREGEILSNRTNKPLKPWITHSGYYTVSLYLDKVKVKVMVHRLVAIKYLDNPNNLPVVNHKDGNKLNNRADNLEYCTYSENNRHAMVALNKNYGQIAIKQFDLDGNLIAAYPSIKEAHRQTNIEYSAIAYCVRGVYKTSGGYYWERATTIRKE